MDRFTSRDARGNAHFPKCFDEQGCAGLGLKDCSQCAFTDKLCERLAAYEDSGLSPDEVLQLYKSGGQYLSSDELANIACALMKLRGYQEAEEQGRLVMLPCKVGDTVYEIDSGRICEMIIMAFEIDNCKCVYLSEDPSCGSDSYDFGDFGETIFLTREEAEQALGAMK